MEEKELKPKAILESMDRDLDYYRKRLFNVFYAVITMQVILVTGSQAIKVDNPSLKNIVYILIFILLTVFVYLFRKEYVQRIYHLRDERRDICRKYFPDFEPFPETGGTTLRPSVLFVVLIAALSIFGAFLTLLSKAI